MVHSVYKDYELGEGYDAVSLCLDYLQERSKDPQKRSEGTGRYNASYGGVADTWVTKGKPYFQTYQYPCHANFRNLRQPQAVYNSFKHNPRLSETARRNYLSWLLSDESPWKTFSARRETHLPKDWSGTKEEFIYRHGWVWSGFDWPVNLQHNFLVASRMAAEWPRLITKWNVWTSKGLDKAVCFLFLDLFRMMPQKRGQDNKQLWQVNSQILYDWPLDIAVSDEKYAWNFINGVLNEKALKGPFKDTPEYTPVNCIFGYNGGKPYREILFSRYNRDTGTDQRMGLTEAESKELHGQSLGFSKFQYDKRWAVTEEEVLKMIQLETERLKNL